LFWRKQKQWERLGCSSVEEHSPRTHEAWSQHQQK
jgi:hypothetical protein